MLIQILRLSLMISLLWIPSIANAQNMTSCITIAQAVKPSTGEDSTFIENKCDQAVFVFWCHDGTGSSACGTEEYFKRGRKMKPDERYFNKYSLPNHTAVHLGACSGSKKNISFSADGTNHYSCIIKDAPIMQPSDPNKINCQDGRKLSYQWHLKYQKGDVTIVRLETEGQIAWINAKTPDVKKFVTVKTPPIPDIFISRLCGEKIAKPGNINKLKNFILDQLDHKNRDILRKCQAELTRSEKCEDFFDQIKNGGAGVRG